MLHPDLEPSLLAPDYGCEPGHTLEVIPEPRDKGPLEVGLGKIDLRISAHVELDGDVVIVLLLGPQSLYLVDAAGWRHPDDNADADEVKGFLKTMRGDFLWDIALDHSWGLGLRLRRSCALEGHTLVDRDGE